MEYPPCKRAQILCLVDNVLNADAVKEARDATSELQEFGADLGEGSAYVSGKSVSFKPGSADCELCKGPVALYEMGAVVARHCVVSGSCELDWTQQYPQNYRDENGNLLTNQLPCGAEVRCRAVIALEDAEDGVGIDVSIARGACKVSDNGRLWRQKMEYDIDHEPKHRPETGIAPNDGIIVEEDVDSPLPQFDNHSER